MTKKEHWMTARGCVYNANYHFVWSTKYRRKVLTDKIAEDLKLLHEKIAKEKGVTLVSQEIMPDHVHLFITMHPKFSPANIVKIFKELQQRNSLKCILKSKINYGMVIFGILPIMLELVEIQQKP